MLHSCIPCKYGVPALLHTLQVFMECIRCIPIRVPCNTQALADNSITLHPINTIDQTLYQWGYTNCIKLTIKK